MPDDKANYRKVLRSSTATLVVQAAIILFCLFGVGQFAANFPFPSPLIKPLLPPTLRWPRDQVAGWIETDSVEKDFLAFFYRDPERNVPAGKNLVSPSDGVTQDIVFRDGVTYLIVGLSFWDVHVVRTPTSGVVTDIEQEGYYYTRNASAQELKEAFFLRGKAAPVQQIVTVDTGHGAIKIRLITSYWASRLKVWVHKGEHLEKGQRIGRILLGSTVVAELPGRVDLTVNKRQRMVGGETVIYRGSNFQ